MRHAGWLLLAVGLLTACQSAPPPSLVPTPAPVISLAVDLDLSDYHAQLSQLDSPIEETEFRYGAPQPTPALLADLDARQIALAVTVYQPTGSAYTVTPLAATAVAMMVHPSNPVVTLSAAQVRQIFTGQVTDWAEVGGPAGPILVLSREAGSATRQWFDAVVLGGLPPTPLALVAPAGHSMVATVAETPNAIGYALLTDVTPAVKLLSIDGVPPAMRSPYPYALPVVALTLAEPDGALRRWLAFTQNLPLENLPPGLQPFAP